MNTHKVLDKHYTVDEGQECYVGSLSECHDFVSEQTPHFMYEVVPLSSLELAFFKKLDENH